MMSEATAAGRDTPIHRQRATVPGAEKWIILCLVMSLVWLLTMAAGFVGALEYRTIFESVGAELPWFSLVTMAVFIRPLLAVALAAGGLLLLIAGAVAGRWLEVKRRWPGGLVYLLLSLLGIGLVKLWVTLTLFLPLLPLMQKANY
jgi:hypothetical protein